MLFQTPGICSSAKGPHWQWSLDETESESVLQVYYQSGSRTSQHQDPALLEISFNEFQCSAICWHLQLHPVHITCSEREGDCSSLLPWEMPWLPLISFTSDLTLGTKEGRKPQIQSKACGTRGCHLLKATSWSLVTLYFVLPTFCRDIGLQSKMVWCVLAGLGRWLMLSYRVMFLTAAPCHRS